MSSEPKEAPDVSVVIPVYKNSASLAVLCDRLDDVAAAVQNMEVIFVVDGSPDDSLEVLRGQVPGRRFTSTLVALSRNFGSFSAIRTGLGLAHGRHIVVISADLQEPPELIVDFVEALRSKDVDLVLGRRVSRADPFMTRVTSGAFWWVYRRLIQPQMPPGGVDVFACTTNVRDALLSMRETNTSLVGQLLWVGFVTVTIDYDRVERPFGKSSWTMRKKLRYMSDSIFAFSDLPIRLLLGVGTLGCVAVIAAAVAVSAAWLFGDVVVQGYTPLMLSLLMVGFILILGLGVVGSYVWRAYENSKARPLTLIRSVDRVSEGTAGR